MQLNSVDRKNTRERDLLLLCTYLTLFWALVLVDRFSNRSPVRKTSLDTFGRHSALVVSCISAGSASPFAMALICRGVGPCEIREYIAPTPYSVQKKKTKATLVQRRTVSLCLFAFSFLFLLSSFPLLAV